MESIKNRTLNSVFWSLIQNIGSNGVSILVSILLARILSPKDFGLIAMLTIFIALSETITNAGFNQALIQKKDADEVDYSSVFWLNLVLAFFLYFILFFSAPFISEFYKQPILTPMTRVLGFVFVINAFAFVQSTRLKKQLQFKKLMYIHIPSVISSGALAIVLALNGFGVWALVYQQIAMRLIYAIQIWVYSKWSPKQEFNWERLKKLFSFGGKLLVSNLIEAFYGNLYLIVIGKFFSVNVLGYYSNARTLSGRPTTILSQAIKEVTFPAFSEIQNDNQKLRNGYKKATQQLFFWICPTMIFLGVLGEPLIQFLLSDKWLPSVPYFQVLCIMGITIPISGFNLDIINVKGRSDLYLKLTILKKTLDTVGIIVAIPFGVMALVWYQACIAAFKTGLNCYFAGKFINYTLKDQLREIFSPTVLISILVGGALYIFNIYTEHWSNLIKLIVGGGCSGLVYLFLSKRMNKTPINDFNEILISRFNFKKSIRRS